jgi:sugar O-acyltransferase (sialic acid O-acetyltransferase NeuD family)
MGTKSWTVFGAGNLINDIHDAIESNKQRLKLIVLNMEVSTELLNKIPSSIKVISIDNFEPSTDYYFFGFINPNKKPLAESLKKYKLTYSNLVHKFSYVSKTVETGQGNFIGPGAVVAPNVKLGDFNYINRLSSIGHDTVVSDCNHFGPGCTVAGRCKIGNKNFFGTGSAVIDGLEIGNEVTIGAGGVVIKSITEKGTYAGVPIRKIK